MGIADRKLGTNHITSKLETNYVPSHDFTLQLVIDNDNWEKHVMNYEPPPTDAVADALSAASLASSVASLPPCPPRSTFASKLNLLAAQWSDIFEDDNGIAAGIFGIEWEDFSSKQLRAICSKLNIKGVRNAKKPDMVQRITRTHKNRKAYGAMLSQADEKLPSEEQEKSSRKQIQCPFRLMNVLFSDDFVEDFATLGNACSRQLLDSGKAGNQQHFWERVSTAYLEPKDSYGTLHFLDDDVIEDHGHIDPSKIIPHDWKKLRTMWKSLNAEYKAALKKFTQSGTHDNNFYSFCNGKVEMYYLQKYLELRPNTTATVEAELPVECAISSDGTQSLSSSGSNKKKKRGNNDIVEAIREFKNSSMDSELARQKLIFMEKEENRRQQEEARLVTEHQQKKQRNLLEEWEKMVANIRDLRKDLRDETLDDASKRETEEDIIALIKRKNQLAIELGLK